MNGVVKELQELNHKLDTIISLLTPVPAKTRAIDSQADLEDITASLLSLPVKKTKTKATTKKAAKSKAKPKPTKTK
jgi:hypothetical protein